MVNDLKAKFDQMYLNTNPWKVVGTINDKIYKIKIKNFLSLSKYHYVLDLGSGEGDTTFLISKYVDKVTAVDISKNAINRAKIKYNSNNIEYCVNGALEFTKKLDTTFDLIFCLEMLYYLQDDEQEELLFNIRQSLKDSGVLYLGLVVSGPNKYGKYFTYDSALKLINKYFKILSVSTAVPKSFKEIPFHKSMIKMLSFFDKDCVLIEKYINIFLNVKYDAYQANFILIKN